MTDPLARLPLTRQEANSLTYGYIDENKRPMMWPHIVQSLIIRSDYTDRPTIVLPILPGELFSDNETRFIYCPRNSNGMSTA